MSRTQCYRCFLCGMESDDIVHYDQTKHLVCRWCANKLFEIAQEGLEFKFQGQVIRALQKRSNCRATVEISLRRTSLRFKSLALINPRAYLSLFQAFL